jgi:hypothetical protein
MACRLGLVVILSLILMQISQGAWIGRRDQGNEEKDPLEIDKNLLKLFLSRTKQFELQDRRVGLSFRVKTKNLNKFLGLEPYETQEEQGHDDENRKPIHENNFSRIT